MSPLSMLSKALKPPSPGISRPTIFTGPGSLFLPRARVTGIDTGSYPGAPIESVEVPGFRCVSFWGMGPASVW